MLDLKTILAPSMWVQWQQHARKGIVLLRSATAAPVNGPGESYFGGLPRLPPEIPWPVTTLDFETTALNFTGQIRLGDLPDFAGREALPASGTLFFFHRDAGCDTQPNDGLPCRVIYHPGNERWPEHRAPDNLSSLRPGLRPWLPEKHRHNYVEFRYPLSFTVASTFPDAEEITEYMLIETLEKNLYDRWPTLRQQWNELWKVAKVLAEEFRAQALSKVLGAPRSARYFLQGNLISTRPAGEQPFDWPFVWGLLRAYAEVVASKQVYGTTAASDWLNVAEQRDELAPVPSDLVAAFRNEVPGHHCHWLETMCCYYANRCCEAGQHETVPEHWHELMREWASWTDREEPLKPFTANYFEMHQMLGHWKHDHCCVRQPDCADDDVLLLQVGGSQQLTFMPDVEGLLHFVISAEALSHRDFSAVRLYN